ncbi:MAG: RNA-binding protein, partial [Caulobacteraceae bacterium]|nr:RNA-binding protein [Caulobacter sp.]
MSGERRLFLDDSPGERRGVVWLDGRPERLLIVREGEPGVRLGERRIGRLGVSGPGGGAWVELGEGPAGWLARTPDGAAAGAAVEVEVQAEARAGKGPRLRARGPAEGAPRLVSSAPDLRARLGAFADAAIESGDDARRAA